MSCPAVLIADDPACHRALATLTVLDRQIIAAHLAGASPITVVHEGDRPALERARELEIGFEMAGEIPKITKPTLLLAGNLAVQTEDLKSIIAESGRLHDTDKTPLPCGMTASWADDLESSLPGGPRVTARGVARWVKDDLSSAQAEDELWDTMGLETDSPVDRNFNRPLGRPLSRLLIHTPISPNVVSVFATLVGVFAAGCFAQGKPQSMILGALILQITAVINCVGSDLARILHRESITGQWLDFAGGQLVHFCLFAGLGVGLHQQQTQSGPGLWLGLAGVLGMVIALVIVLRARQNPAPHPRLQSFIQKTANRDFTLLLLALAVVNRVEWFLWAGAIGVHCFWLVALGLQRKSRHEAAGETA